MCYISAIYRSGATSGSCFSSSFGGLCSGTPEECRDCNKVKLYCVYIIFFFLSNIFRHLLVMLKIRRRQLQKVWKVIQTQMNVTMSASPLEAVMWGTLDHQEEGLQVGLASLPFLEVPALEFHLSALTVTRHFTVKRLQQNCQKLITQVRPQLLRRRILRDL